jgi:hypothetical protein
MTRAGGMTFGDLIGRLDWLDIACPKCDRRGRYRVNGLAAQHGQNYRIPDWISDMTRDCPRRRSPGLADACGATCPGLLEIK